MAHKNQNRYLAPLAKKYIRDWANSPNDPESFFKQSYMARLTKDQEARLYATFPKVAYALREAFQTKDEYERDWLLFWARKENAVGISAFGRFAELAGWITTATHSRTDRAIAYVQKNLADKMASCANKCRKPCFYRKRKGQKYCSTQCAEAAQQRSGNKWWAEHGKQWRVEYEKRRKRTRNELAKPFHKIP